MAETATKRSWLFTALPRAFLVVVVAPASVGVAEARREGVQDLAAVRAEELPRSRTLGHL